MLVESSCSYRASICCTGIALWCITCGQSGKRRGGQQPCPEGNFTPLGGISPSAAVQERGCPANPPQPQQDCRPWPLAAPPRAHPRGAAEFKPGLALHQPRQSALVFTAPLRICSGIQGRLPGLSRSLFLDMQGASEAHAGDVPLSPRSCLSKQETESSTDLGRVLGLMFVHVQILLQIVASLFYY